MADSNSITNDFLRKITGVIEENFSNEQFGVSELAKEIGMSRSNLLRKIKKATDLSVSQFIRQVRLKNAMDMLRANDLTVSEVSYAVGFGSTSYFVKCFHDHYGFPPGEVSNRVLSEINAEPVDQPTIAADMEPTKTASFWDELKRRKVGKVIIIYATISFVLLQLLSVLIEPLYLPQWSMTLVIVLLAVGFPIAILFSWIFDVTPSGIRVTQSLTQEGMPKQGSALQKKGIVFSIITGILLVIVAIFAYPRIFKENKGTLLNPELEKSIAVLPFRNDSGDSTNVYIINGLMESILTNLQHIEDLRVISRTSVEKFRNDSKTIPEIADALNVNYFVEGSGQKIGDEILLNIQLIDGTTDTHLWGGQYKRDAKDIFQLQQEVAKSIAQKIQAIITPEEVAQIEKVPTKNLTAYDYFLRGLDLFYSGTSEGLEKAIWYFRKAISYDPEYARAYADIAISYYLLDAYQAKKQFSDSINVYAEKALSYDPKSPQGLTAKAMFYMNHSEPEMAVPYLEKALQYHPNSAMVIGILTDFYTDNIPNTEKYLEYALKGIQLDIAAHDSTTASYIYLRVSNAFIQSGFIDEAEKYIDRSLQYNAENLFSEYVKAYILYAKNGDLGQTKSLLLKAYQKEPTRLDIIQEVAKICYFMRDYDSAYDYYKKFTEIRKAQNLDMYRAEDAKIGVVLDKKGLSVESDTYFDAFLEYAENDRSIYKDLSLAAYYSYKGNTTKALEHMALFAEQDNYHLWTVIFLKIDPLMDNIKELPEFQQLMNQIENKFWDKHEKIKTMLVEKSLL